MKITHIDHSHNEDFTVQLNKRFYIEVRTDIYPNKTRTNLEVSIFCGINEQGEQYQIRDERVPMFKEAIQEFVNEDPSYFGYEL
jgi:hypothetical protein